MRLGRPGTPDALVVVGGLLGNRRWLVDLKDVGVVQPRRCRVSLADGPLDVRALGRTGRTGLGPSEQTAPC